MSDSRRYRRGPGGRPPKLVSSFPGLREALKASRELRASVMECMLADASSKLQAAKFRQSRAVPGLERRVRLLEAAKLAEVDSERAIAHAGWEE